jgi:hypothetical protein
MNDNIKRLPTSIVQWVLLNEITDNVINRLMESNVSKVTSHKLLYHT